MIKAVIFDLGGVYFTNGTTLALRRFSRMLGVPEKRLKPLFRPMEGPALAYRTGRVGRDAFWKHVLGKLGTGCGDWEKLEAAWARSYRPLDGMDRVVGRLKRRFKVAAVSGNAPGVAAYLRQRYMLGERFDVCLFSFEVGTAKDHPRIFNEVMKRLDARAEECLFIDDKRSYVEAARRLGMRTIKFSTPARLRSSLKQMGLL
jgi:HAD superfamily hydrolase (TIGR01509 family)